MSRTVWKPNVTVAALVRQGERFLLVEERTEEGIRFNQPAGHLEAGESLTDAVIRECREETGYPFQPSHLLGVYQWTAPSGISYLRFAFVGTVGERDPQAKLDHGIIGPCWQTLSEISQRQAAHRSHLVLRCVEDVVAGKYLPLDNLHYFS